MAENKVCKQCNTQFIVQDDDLEFYDKVSPTFNGKKYSIPTPTLCPECRQQRRIAFRNDRSLYKRKDDLSGAEIISMYPQDAQFVVYDHKKWWSDAWDGLEYGKDYDSTRSFINQFGELLKVVPKISLMNKNSEDSDFSMYASDLKNCYLISSALSSENCQYGYQCNWSKDCTDISYLYDSELCYEAIDSRNCYNSKFIQNCDNCSDVSFAYGCRSCKNCFLCTNLVNKEYCFNNEQLTKDEFDKKISEFGWSYGEVEGIKKKLTKMVKDCVHVYSHLFNCENCTGDYLRECNNCKNCYDLPKSEDSKYIWTGIRLNNCMDCCYSGLDSELSLECLSAFPSKSCLSCAYCWESSNLYYCDYCFSCKDCFGCAGLKNKQYCILNKQYTKDEYNKKVAEIVENMQKIGEWGEFFPISLSPFGYNISTAYDYYPLSKSDVLNLGASWQDNDYSQNFNAETIKPEENINHYKNNPKEIEKLLNSIIKCEVSGKLFKIMPQELAFYMKNNLPIPRKHFNIRHIERFKMRNGRKLYHRTCMNEGCDNEFETTYAPDRPEKVYCEKCYQKSIL